MKAIKLLYVLVSRFSYLLWNSQPRERKFVATLMFWVTELVKEANFKDTITLWDLQVREINNFSLHKNFCQNERAGQGQLGFPRCLSDKVTRHVLPNPCKCPVKPTGWAHSISWSVNPSQEKTQRETTKRGAVRTLGLFSALRPHQKNEIGRPPVYTGTKPRLNPNKEHWTVVLVSLQLPAVVL